MADITFSISYDSIRDQVLTYINDNSEVDPVTHEQLARSLYLAKMKDEYVAMKIGDAKTQAELDINNVV